MINVGCGVLFGFGEFFWAGIVLIVANLFDMLDGNVARLTGNVTQFGGFLDSSLDRVSDMVCFFGIMVFYAGNTPQHSLLNVILAGIGLIGSVMVSYTTARSESLGVKANVGFLQRPERIVLFIIGALSTWDWNSDFFFSIECRKCSGFWQSARYGRLFIECFLSGRNLEKLKRQSK